MTLNFNGGIINENGLIGGFVMVARKYEIDMSKGSILKNMLMFAFPLMLSNILQLLYNAADQIVVGRWGSENSLAAVGSTSTLTILLTNLFIGLSIGASVTVSKKYGARDMVGLRNTTHTTITLGFICGIAACILGQIVCRPVLQLMGTPAEVIGLSELYMRIIFIGVPAQLVYNFGAAILRSVGDTKRPLYILSATGMVNVVLNLFLVIGFKMDVAGVAIATATAHYLSASTVLYSLIRSDTPYKINPKNLKLHKEDVKQIVSIGLPAGIQSCMFSLANLVVQSSVNSFGPATMAGRTAGSSIEGFVYTSMDSFYQATLTSVSQNYGAKQEKRIYKTIGIGILCASVAGLVLGILVYVFGKQLLGLYVSSTAANYSKIIKEGMIYITVCGLPYFLCGIMNVTTGALRGLGHSKTPAINSLLGACGFRLLWILVIMPFSPNLHTTWFLYLCWPISWMAVIALNVVNFIVVRKKSIEKMYAQQ